ncbi:hypothetical protein ABMA77_03565 [Halobacteriovorax sp. RZ-1]|uniref:hypothetical protein n=1 Tax=unclassified Halobacteriovorax TaxID=2639665 RepID=UPI00371700B7
MQFLKIENGKGHFSVDGVNWVEIHDIDKNNILNIISVGIEEGFEMDNPEEKVILNKAHEIIYDKLYGKFTELNEQRTRFKDESENLYKDALEKYKE